MFLRPFNLFKFADLYSHSHHNKIGVKFKLYFSEAAFDTPYMYKTAEAKDFSLVKVFCRCMDKVGGKISNVYLMSRNIKVLLARYTVS